MVTEKILKQLTPERVKKELEAINQIKLPLNLQKEVDEYNKVGKRNPFIWKCMYAFAPYGTLPNVMKEYQKLVHEAKIIGMLFVALADDLADRYKNKKLLDKVLSIPFNQNFKIGNSFSLDQQQYLRSSQKIWNSLEKTIQEYPYYREFKLLFEFDYHQVFNSLKYGYLLNKNLHLINLDESRIYLPHNMQMFVNCTIDLMCLSKFNIKELKTLRRIVRNAQMMGRISNCLSTWERELEENDFSSLVFAYAIRHNIITTEELQRSNKEKIREKIKRSNYQKYFLSEWQEYYKKIEALNKGVSSINISQYLKGSEEILKMYLIVQGLT